MTISTAATTDFTDQEIEQAVQQLIKTSISRSYGALGNRQIGQTFNDFQEQTIAVVTLTPNAPYYVVELGTERVVTNIADVSDTIEHLDAAIQALGRAQTPVGSIASLANAKVAATALSLAAGSRTKALADVQSAPAFMRLSANIQQFLTDYSTPNITQNGQLIGSAEEGRAAIPGLVRDLKTGLQLLLTKIQNLSNSMDDYGALNLPALLSSGVVQRAAVVIGQMTTLMSQLTPETRVAQIRTVTLNLLAARTVIRNFGSLSSPVQFVGIEGTGGVWADPLHPAVPAHLVADLPGAYAARVDSAATTNQLDFLIETFRTKVSMSGSFEAVLTGAVAEPFVITAATNDQLELTFINAGIKTVVVVGLTAGTRTAAQVCADINGALGVDNAEAVAQIVPLKFQGAVDIGGTDPAAITFTNLNPFSDWAAIGIKNGDKIQVLGGANLGQIYQINSSGVTALVLTCTRLTGAGTVVQANQLIEVGGPDLAIQLKLTDVTAAQAIPGRWYMAVTAGSDQTDTVKRASAANLGFSPGGRATSRPLDAKTMASSINAATTTVLADRPRLSCSVVTRPIQLGGSDATGLLARSEPSAPSTLVIYRVRARGPISTGGTAAVMTIMGAGAAGVVVGDIVSVRSSSVGSNVNVTGVVTGIAGDVVSATMTSALTIDTNALLEVAVDFSALGYDVVATLTGSANAGDYTVQGGLDNSLGLTLSASLPAFQDIGGSPVFMSCQLSRQYLAFDSTDLTLASTMQVDDGSPTNPSSGAALLFAIRPATSVGQTQWFRLPARPDEQIEVGDVLELFVSAIDTPTFTRTITSYDSAALILELDQPLDCTLATFNFSIGAPTPFARIRKTRHDTFDTFATSARQWLASVPLQTSWLTELDRRVTIALADPSPTTVQNLRFYLVELYATLTVAGAAANNMSQNATIESIVESYTAPVISEIDTLVESLHAQGADRALDILLDGRFSDYFGLDVDGMSYAGAVLSATKQVMQNDLQVRSVRRKEQADGQVTMAQYQDPDYEFDQSDIDNSLVPDAKSPNPSSSQGDAY